MVTDGWAGYRGLEKLGYTHEPRSQRAARARGEDPGELLPAVHRVGSLTKRWLLGTHHGAIDDARLPDYLDGFLARVTGQYSRMGALLDPVVDRLTILSGGAVCWYFNLLPRWALALLVLREIITLILAQYGLRHGVDIEVNWLGRVAVFPIMAAIFFAMVLETWVTTVLLIVGLVLAILATILYARMGREAALQAKAHSP